jgi:nicotinamide-nucleotide adenylyltransferase
MRRGLYIGKFQPYTNAHHAFVKEIVKDVDELIFGIGGAQVSRELLQPFTAGERVMMVARNVRDLGVPVYIIPIEDVSRTAVWVAQVKSLTPPFDVVYTSSHLVQVLFSQAGISCMSPPDACIHQRVNKFAWISAVAEDNCWEEGVPAGTIQVMREIDGVARVRSLSFF